MACIHCCLLFCLCSVSETEVEVLVDEVVEQLLKQTSITEISAEKQKVDEEKRSIQEARSEVSPSRNILHRAFYLLCI